MFGLFNSSREKILEEQNFELMSDNSRLRNEMYQLKMDAISRQKEWRELVTLINSKGGQEFLDSNLASNKRSEYDNKLSKSEIKTLIILCHPDKHGSGSHGEMAENIFKKLLNLK